MKVVYVAGPYTSGDVILNVQKAIEAADALKAGGFLPYVPHLDHLWHLVKPHPYEYWMSMGLRWVAVCDAVLRIPGESRGADMEVRMAEELEKPIVFASDSDAGYSYAISVLWGLLHPKPRRGT